MYPQIEPQLTVSKTISHPIKRDQVYGFEARNTMLGRSAIILKEEAINRAGVHVPSKVRDFIINNDAELVVLDGDEVLTMEASDFEAENELNTLKGSDGTVTMHTVRLSSDSFVYWNRELVKINQ